MISASKLGDTGIRVGEIGLGCEGFHVEQGALIRPLLDMAERNGVNAVDLYIPDPAVRSGLIEALMFSVNPCYDLQPATEDVEALWAH